MLYVLKQTIGNSSYNIALIEEYADGTYATFNDFIYDYSIQEALSENHQIGLETVIADDKNLIVPVVYSSNNVSNFTGIVNKLYSYFMKELDDTAIEKLTLAVKKVVPNFTSDTFKAVSKSLAQLEDYIKNGASKPIVYKESILADKVSAIRIIEKINIDFSSLSYIRDKRNHTLFMNNCDDEVYIKLGDYEHIVLDTAFDGVSKEDFFNPYPRKEYESYGFMEAFRRYNDIDIKLITGNPDNNDLPIQENEEYFYNCMKELIDFINGQEFETSTPEECAKEKVCSPTAKRYLLELATTVAGWNWGHTGFYSIGSSEGQEDNESEDYKETSDVAGNLDFVQLDVGVKFVDAAGVLRDYIDAAVQEDIYSLAEAVVKLARWGKRKPSKFKLSASDYYVDLTTYRINKVSGSIKDMEVEKIKGATYSLEHFITYQQKIQDSAFCKKHGTPTSTLRVPIGAVCIKRYTTGVVQTEVMSLPTLLRYVAKNPTDVDGLQYVDGKFITKYNYENVEEISHEVVLEQIRNGSVEYMEFFNDDTVIDLFMEFTAYSNAVTELNCKAFTVMDIEEDFETYAFTTKDELIDKVCRNRNLSTDLKNRLKQDTGKLLSPAELTPYLEATINRRFTDIVFGVNQIYMDAYKVGNELNIDQILNAYSIMMEKYHYSSPLLQTPSEGSKGSEVKQTIVSDLAKMASFGDTSKPKEMSDKEEGQMLLDKIYTGVEGATRSARLVNNDNETIGYVYVINTTSGAKYALSKYPPEHFTTPNPIQLKGSMNFLQLVKIALKDYLFTLKGNLNASKLRFTDEESWAEIAVAVSNALK